MPYTTMAHPYFPPVVCYKAYITTQGLSRVPQVNPSDVPSQWMFPNGWETTAVTSPVQSHWFPVHSQSLPVHSLCCPVVSLLFPVDSQWLPSGFHGERCA